ncbi:hypothetical protein Q4488_10730 [Amphritea sp. 1_MG-2023]|nr:hypothetical protein [Amphritea sp. 1_MG-2023]MDO6563856.1 hypothetical protein [Amphritea sp. 1_MG-2023]
MEYSEEDAYLEQLDALSLERYAYWDGSGLSDDELSGIAERMES